MAAAAARRCGPAAIVAPVEVRVDGAGAGASAGEKRDTPGRSWNYIARARAARRLARSVTEGIASLVLFLAIAVFEVAGSGEMCL